MLNYGKLSDNELLSSLKKGDQNAFAELYSRYWAVLLLHARNILQSEEAARDIVQDLFAELWLNAAKIELVSSLSSYLYRTVRNKVINQLKRQKYFDLYRESLQTFTTAGAVNADSLIREKQLAVIIEQQIMALPEKMRRIFVLSRKQYLSHQEISQKLGVSEHTVKSQISNALRILKTKIGLAGIVAMALLQNK